MKKRSPLSFSELMELPGMQYINRTHRRTFSLNIFRTNALELRKVLDLYRNFDVAIRIHMEADKDLSRQFHREVARLLHNYLAGAMTLVDHTRAFVDKNYEHTDLRREFKSRVDKTFKENGLTRFVQDLRNYMVHRGPPPVDLNITMKNQGNGRMSGSSQIIFKVRNLLEWTGWKSDAKSYLKSCGDTIDIYALEGSYTAVINSFHDELDGLIRNFHAADMVQFQEEYDAFESAQSVSASSSDTAEV